MSVKGGVFDASGQPIASVRIVTDVDALAGLGTSTYPIRTDPVGTTVQPVSIASGSVSITGPATVTANQGTAGGTAWPVSVASLPLPAGAALDSSLATLHADLATLDTDLKSTQPRSVTGTVSVGNFPGTQPVSGTVAVSNFPATQPVSGTITTTPPANASTNVTQIAGAAVSLGAKTSAASIPVVLASDEAALAVTGTFFQATQPVSGTFWQATQPVSGTVTTTPPANASTNLTQVAGAAVSLGAKTSANSIPVVLASDEAALPVTGTFFQATQPVSGTVAANAGTNLNTSLLALEAGGNLASIKADVDKIPSQGQALSAASMPVVLPATQIATLTPPTSVGVNNFPATQPVSAASLPLPGNAAQETSGNLATLVLQTRNDAQIIDILNAILGQLKLLNLNLASAMPSSHVDSDTWVMDTLPTLQ